MPPNVNQTFCSPTIPLRNEKAAVSVIVEICITVYNTWQIRNKQYLVKIEPPILGKGAKAERQRLKLDKTITIDLIYHGHES